MAKRDIFKYIVYQLNIVVIHLICTKIEKLRCSLLHFNVIIPIENSIEYF